MSLRKGKGAVNAYLEILLHRNQLQLATTDALYSDGNRYIPAVAALDALKPHLSSVSNVLVLGSGLGSMVRVMRSRGLHPQFTLVELDKIVLEWAIEFLDAENITPITPVCMDAGSFMAQNTARYDLIFIDIFDSRVVPSFVTTALFLLQCRDSLSPGGHLSFNYIVNDLHQWESVQNTFKAVFPNHSVLNLGLNRIFVV